MFFDKKIFEVIPNVKKNSNGRENWANAGEGNKELDMTLPRQVLATHRTPCRRFRIRLHLRMSRRSSPELALLQGSFKPFRFSDLWFLPLWTGPGVTPLSPVLSVTDSESDGEGPSTPQPVTPERPGLLYLYLSIISSLLACFWTGRASSSSASWPAPALGAVLALWFGSCSRTMYRGFYPMTNHITCVRSASSLCPIRNSTLMDPEAYGGKWVLTLCVQHCIPGLMESYAEINYRDVPDIANDIIAHEGKA